MAEALKHNNTLKSLTIQKADLTDTSAQYLADALKTNTTLQNLNLDENHITKDGIKLLRKAWNAKKRGKLSINDNTCYPGTC
ncbi:MAG: hypothetical protein ACON5A_06105 [Candidatus Comchoanobacterales bacterium]